MGDYAGIEVYQNSWYQRQKDHSLSASVLSAEAGATGFIKELVWSPQNGVGLGQVSPNPSDKPGANPVLWVSSRDFDSPFSQFVS